MFVDWTPKEWAISIVFFPALFAWAFFLFGGWAVFSEPWSTRVAVVVYGVTALFLIAIEIQRRAGR
jgi:hypothetical protein